ncbi:PucC family protein [Haladaptatus sp. NG-WS-4]
MNYSDDDDTDWLWHATMYVTLGVVVTVLGSGVVAVLVLALDTVGVFLSAVVSLASLFFGVYFVLKGLAVHVGAVVDGRRIET